MTRPLWLLLGLVALAAAFTASLALGATDLPFTRAVQVLLRPDGSNESLVVQTLRLPRTLVALLAGAGLGVSGLLLQAVTRNPLADPGILGVEAGGAFAALLLVVFFHKNARRNWMANFYSMLCSWSKSFFSIYFFS